MRCMMRIVGTVLAAGVVSACATGAERWADDPVPDGTRLSLHETVPVSTYTRRAHIQGGAAVDPGRIDRFTPHCYIRVRDTEVRAVEPGEFEVGGYRTRREVAGSGMGMPLLVAGTLQERGSSHSRNESRVGLYSADQPHVHEMICAYDSTVRRAPHLGFADIRDVLEGVGTLTRP